MSKIKGFDLVAETVRVYNKEHLKRKPDKIETFIKKIDFIRL